METPISGLFGGGKGPKGGETVSMGWVRGAGVTLAAQAFG